MTGQPPRELATVTRLPVHADAVDAEIVTPEEWARVQQEKAARARLAGYRGDVVTVARVTRTAVTHPVTKSTARHLYYIGAGATVVVRRRHSRKTLPDRMARTAEQVGDSDKAEKWFTLGETSRASRHKRRMDWFEMPFRAAKALVVAVLLWFAALLILGVVVAFTTKDAGRAFDPLIGFVTFIGWLWWALTVSWALLLALAGAVTVTVLWHVGRTSGVTPKWLATGDTVTDDAVTPGGVATALAHLGIPALNKAIKDGWVVEFLTPPTLVNGRGYQTVFSLPMGVTPSAVADKRDVLARNLLRAPLEVWPTAAERSGFVDLWVAHPGATTRDGSPYPLLHDGQVDVFVSVPLGESQRGDVIGPPLMEASMGVGGLPGQGKSNAVRVIMAGAALDPLADLRVYVFAGNGDFDAYEPRLSRYRRGVDDSVVVDAVAELRELYREVERREGRLADLGAKKLSRNIASQHPDMRPIVVAFSEVHELFSHPDLGKEAADLAVAIVKRMRKTGIFMVFDTQSSRAAAIPSALVELFKYNACFAVKTWRSNDGFLGDGSFQAGIRATELRPGKDRGTSLLTGVTDERFELLNWFYLEADDDTGFDAATDIIARSLRSAKVTPARSADPEEARDLLDDVHEAFDQDDRVKATDMAARLRELAPRYRPYRSLNGTQLAEWLSREGVRVTDLDGVLTVRAERVLRALDERQGVE